MLADALLIACYTRTRAHQHCCGMGLGCCSGLCPPLTNKPTLVLQAIAQPDPGDYYNVAETHYYIRNPRIDTSEFSAKIPLGNAMQACNSVVFFGDSDILQPGNGTPQY